MFKILVLQRLFNISDDQTEYQVKDRISFMRFLGVTLGNRVPDAKTIWLFRENLTKAGVVKELFDLFTNCLESQGIITRAGSMADASFADAPRRRNSREENKKIKEKKYRKNNINKLRQKDTDARWTKKGNETHYGYKDHT
jgi:IS5 family transposase